MDILGNDGSNAGIHDDFDSGYEGYGHYPNACGPMDDGQLAAFEDETDFGVKHRNAWKRVSDPETWQTRDGRILQISEMDPHHCLNTMRMLERQAKMLQVYAMIFDTDLWSALNYAETAPDGAYDAVMGEVRGTLNLYHADPLVWIKQTPTYKALEARVNGRTKLTLGVRNKVFNVRRKVGLA